MGQRRGFICLNNPKLKTNKQMQIVPKGKVIDKYMTGDESIIKVEVWAENQKDEITAPGQGEVVLPMMMLGCS